MAAAEVFASADLVPLILAGAGPARAWVWEVGVRFPRAAAVALLGLNRAARAHALAWLAAHPEVLVLAGEPREVMLASHPFPHGAQFRYELRAAVHAGTAQFRWRLLFGTPACSWTLGEAAVGELWRESLARAALSTIGPGRVWRQPQYDEARMNADALRCLQFVHVDESVCLADRLEELGIVEDDSDFFEELVRPLWLPLTQWSPREEQARVARAMGAGYRARPVNGRAIVWERA